MTSKKIYDIVVVGAGPAGLTAALYARRFDKEVLVLEKETFGGQMTFSPKIENYPGFKQVSGNELADGMVDQVLAQGADIELDRVTEIKLEGKHKRVITENGEYLAKAVIIAAGARHRLLGLEGETELIGNGISFCAVCDGAFFKDGDVAVIGGGNSALQEALLLSEQCRSVYVIQNFEYFTGEDRLVALLGEKSNVNIMLGYTVKSLVAQNGSLAGIVVKNEKYDTEKTIKLDGMFVAIGLVPQNSAFASLTELDERGYIISNEGCLTSTEGIFVAGDCRTKGLRQIATAVADGASAAIAANGYVDSNNL